MSDLKPCPVCKGQSGGIGSDGVENDCMACFAREVQAASPRVEACIASCLARYHGESKAAQARYFEEVHQRLAPLARSLEIELAEAKAELARRTQPEATTPEKSEHRKGYEQANADYCKMIETNCHYRERVFNDILKADAAEGMNRFTRTAPAQDLGAAILALPLPNTNLTAEVAGYKVPVYGAQHMRDFAMSALASPADALRAGDRVDLDNWNTQMAGVQALLECTDGELECISEGPLNAYIEHVKRIYAAILQSQKGGSHG